MKIKFIICVLLIVVAIGFSGCVQSQTDVPAPELSPVTRLKIIVDERTGDLSSKWISKPPGWYNMYLNTEGKVSWYRDRMESPSSDREVSLLLITEDPNPNFVVNSADSFYKLTTDVLRVSSVPRGYPAGGKRVYQVKIDYNLVNMDKPNIITIRDDYYDVKDESFHIDLNANGEQGYS